jgi:hypothetical protein
LAEGFEGGGGHGGDGQGVTDGIEHFDGIPLRAIRSHVVIHQLDDIATLETMFRHVAGQRGICIEFKLHRFLICLE